MEERRCFGCMQLTSEPVCPHCGCPAEGANLPYQLGLGTVLRGRYLVGRAIGQTAGSITYIALDQSREKTVTVRELFSGSFARREGTEVCPTDEAGFGQGLEQFRRFSGILTEDETLKRVCSALEAFEENGTAYLAAEIVRGPGLGRYVQLRGGVLTAQEALRILKDILDAVAALHQAGMAHGGISMDSIVLDPMGGARLTGFGETDHAAPEEDVYALCRVICGCLGKEGTPVAELPGLSSKQATALEVGLSPDPQARFASAVALRRALLEEPIPEPPVEAPAQPPQPEFPATEAINSAIPVWTPPQEPEYPRSPDQPQPRPEPKKKSALAIGLIIGGAALLIIAMVVCFLTVHIWKDATCEDPRTCVLCGETEGKALGHSWEGATCEAPQTCIGCGDTKGSALGHDWMDATCETPKTCLTCGVTEGDVGGHGWTEATCTEPSRCIHCGMTQGSALGHDWQAATYTNPQTCRTCGITEGNVRGYYESVSGHSERFYTTNFNSWCLTFDDPLEQCKQFTLNVFVTDVDYGTVEGRWEAFYQDMDGAWISLGYFDMTGTSASVTYTFNPAEGVKAVAAVIADRRSASYSKYVTVTEVYTLD